MLAPTPFHLPLVITWQPKGYFLTFFPAIGNYCYAPNGASLPSEPRLSARLACGAVQFILLLFLRFFSSRKHTFVCPGMGYSLTAATSTADSCLAYLSSFVGLTWYTRLFPHHSLPSTRLALYRPDCASGGPNPGTFL